MPHSTTSLNSDGSVPARVVRARMCPLLPAGVLSCSLLPFFVSINARLVRTHVTLASPRPFPSLKTQRSFIPEKKIQAQRTQESAKFHLSFPPSPRTTVCAGSSILRINPDPGFWVDSRFPRRAVKPPQRTRHDLPRERDRGSATAVGRWNMA